jgi:hypothetical protein
MGVIVIKTVFTRFLVEVVPGLARDAHTHLTALAIGVLGSKLVDGEEREKLTKRVGVLENEKDEVGPKLNDAADKAEKAEAELNEAKDALLSAKNSFDEKLNTSMKDLEDTKAELVATRADLLTKDETLGYTEERVNNLESRLNLGHPDVEANPTEVTIGERLDSLIDRTGNAVEVYSDLLEDNVILIGAHVRVYGDRYYEWSRGRLNEYNSLQEATNLRRGVNRYTIPDDDDSDSSSDDESVPPVATRFSRVINAVRSTFRRVLDTREGSSTIVEVTKPDATSSYLTEDIYFPSWYFKLGFLLFNYYVIVYPIINAYLYRILFGSAK